MFFKVEVALNYNRKMDYVLRKAYPSRRVHVNKEKLWMNRERRRIVHVAWICLTISWSQWQLHDQSNVVEKRNE